MICYGVGVCFNVGIHYIRMSCQYIIYVYYPHTSFPENFKLYGFFLADCSVIIYIYTYIQMFASISKFYLDIYLLFPTFV